MRKFYVIRRYHRDDIRYYYYDYELSIECYSENISFATLYESEEHATRELTNLNANGLFEVVGVYRKE